MTITTTAGPDLVALKNAQHQIWSSGDYGSVAWITVPLADELIAAVDLAPGRTVLDVATGTGHVALAAARSVLPDDRDRLRRRARRRRRPPGRRRRHGHHLRRR